MTRLIRRLPEIQFVRFCAVGASGYAVNLAVYAALLAAGLHYLAAAAIAFLVAAASNYLWNRTWTFRTSGAPVLGQGARALVVSALSLGANQLFLVVLVAAGAGHLAGAVGGDRPRHSLQLRGKQAVGVRRATDSAGKFQPGAGSTTGGDR